MKKIINLFLVLLLTTTACNKEFLEGELPNEGEALINLAIEEKAMTGIAAAYSQRGYNWEYTAGFGNREEEQVFASTTLTRIASIAKPMTAIAILQLYEAGQLDLDIPIQEYLSDFPVKPEGDITTRHLLNHSSGIPAYKDESEIENQIEYQSLQEAIDLFKNRDLVAIPGTAFNYTTYGYVVLGRIIEQISGQTYETYMRENIWEPAGMFSTGVEQTNESYSNKSELYFRKDNGKIVSATANNLSDRIPGGGIQSTLEDMVKFGEAILNNTFISKASLELMFEPPAIENGGIPYGAGWYKYNDNPVYGHGGAQTGASTIFMMAPEYDIFVVVLSNTSRTSDEVFKIAVKLFEIAPQ